jgi:hypothetical protein
MRRTENSLGLVVNCRASVNIEPCNLVLSELQSKDTEDDNKSA